MPSFAVSFNKVGVKVLQPVASPFTTKKETYNYFLAVKEYLDLQVDFCKKCKPYKQLW